MRVAQANTQLTGESIFRAVFGGPAKPEFQKAAVLADFCRADPVSVASLSGFWRPGALCRAESKLGSQWLQSKPYNARPCSSVCSRCLAEAEYSKAEWDIGFYTSCPMHNIALIDICPRCNATLSLSRKRICQCSCGFDFRLIENVNPSDASLEISKGLWRNLWAEDAALGEPFEAIGPATQLCSVVNLDTVIPLLWFFGITLPALISREPIRGQRMMCKRQADVALEMSVRFINRWPGDFLESLNQLWSARSVHGNAEAERVFRDMWQRIIQLTNISDNLNLRGTFLLEVRSILVKNRRTRSLRACRNQLELPFER
jgi:TniQ